MKSPLKSLLQIIEEGESAICTVLLIIITFLIFAQVVNRYWLHFEIMWFNDMALYGFVFFMFLAAAFATVRQGHVSVDFIRNMIVKERPLRAALYRIFLGFLAIAVLSILLPVGYQFMLEALQYPEYGTLVRWFNTSWLQITLVVSIVLMLIHLLQIMQKDIGDIRKNLAGRSGRERE